MGRVTSPRMASVRLAGLGGRADQLPEREFGSGGFNFCVQGTYSASIRCDDGIDPGREDRQMLLYVQTWLPLLTITLTAAIFFSVASFIMGHAKA